MDPKTGPKIRKVRVPEKHYFYRREHPPISAVPLPGADPRPEDYHLAAPALREDLEAERPEYEGRDAPPEDPTPNGAPEDPRPEAENAIFVPRPRQDASRGDPAAPGKECPYCELPNAAGAEACETCGTPLR